MLVLQSSAACVVSFECCYVLVPDFVRLFRVFLFGRCISGLVFCLECDLQSSLSETKAHQMVVTDLIVFLSSQVQVPSVRWLECHNADSATCLPSSSGSGHVDYPLFRLLQNDSLRLRTPDLGVVLSEIDTPIVDELESSVDHFGNMISVARGHGSIPYRWDESRRCSKV